jgi:hypothetical protein
MSASAVAASGLWLVLPLARKTRLLAWALVPLAARARRSGRARYATPRRCGSCRSRAGARRRCRTWRP